MKPSETKRLHEFEEENSRVLNIVADLSLDRAVLQRAVRRLTNVDADLHQEWLSSGSLIHIIDSAGSPLPIAVRFYSARARIPAVRLRSVGETAC